MSIPLTLNPETRKEWGYLSPSRYRICLEGKDPDSVEPADLVVLGVKKDEVPQALAIASVDSDFLLGEVFSLHGEESALETLLQDLEKALKAKKCKLLTTVVPTDTLEWPFLQTLMQKNGWHGPKPFMEKYFFDCYTFQPKWFINEPRLKPGYKIFPWRTVTEKEKQHIKHFESQGHFYDSNSPFYEEDQPEPKEIFLPASFLLRFQGKVIGWSITHKMAKDTLRYTTLYVAKEHLSSGAAVELLKASIKAQQKSLLRWSVFEVNLLEVSPSWVNFVRKRLGPYAIAISHFVQFWKGV